MPGGITATKHRQPKRGAMMNMGFVKGEPTRGNRYFCYGRRNEAPCKDGPSMAADGTHKCNPGAALSARGLAVGLTA
jgi:hypothetical protein